jgi:NMD protein affecting ribosome stability and mRNA decay
MDAEKTPTKVKCIRCGREIDFIDNRAGSEEESLCTRCYEKMIFPETRFKNMEMYD